MRATGSPPSGRGLLPPGSSQPTVSVGSARVGVTRREVNGVAEDEVGVKELRLDAQKHLLSLIAGTQSAPAIEMYARAFRYLAGGPQPGSIEVKS